MNMEDDFEAWEMELAAATLAEAFRKMGAEVSGILDGAAPILEQMEKNGEAADAEFFRLQRERIHSLSKEEEEAEIDDMIKHMMD